MLRLNILSTLCGGNDSVVMSLVSAWLSRGTCKVFSLPEVTFGIFLGAPDDEKRGIGQCRSIAKTQCLQDHVPEGVLKADYSCRYTAFVK